MDAVPFVTQPYYKARWKFWTRSSTASSPSLSRCANTSPGLTPGVSPMNQSALMSTFGGNIITSCGLQNVGACTFETSERYNFLNTLEWDPAIHQEVFVRRITYAILISWGPTCRTNILDQTSRRGADNLHVVQFFLAYQSNHGG
jgi:hypothetical protein